MPDHPIIFSAPMVRALLDGRKTQTRRLAWRERKCSGGPINDGGGQMDYVEPSMVRSPSPWKRVQPGDRLWVREAWCPNALTYGQSAHYRADGKHVVLDDGDGFTVTNRDGFERSPWRPSIHMPRWASRLTLHVEAVRVERQQAISEDDAGAEGVTDFAKMRAIAPHEDLAECQTRLRWRQREFAMLWDRLHGPGAWEANPEVVVLTFRVQRGNIDA